MKRIDLVNYGLCFFFNIRLLFLSSLDLMVVYQKNINRLFPGYRVEFKNINEIEYMMNEIIRQEQKLDETK